MQAQPISLPHLPWLGVAALLVFSAWRVHGRIRKLLTRQPVRPWRHRLGVGLFGYIAVGLLFNLWGHWLGFAAFGLTFIAGGALAVVGVRRTRFEWLDDGLHYTPDARIGIGLSLVLVARVVWRLGEMALGGGMPQHLARVDELLDSPATLAVLGLLAGYYFAYALGLLRQRRALAAGALRA